MNAGERHGLASAATSLRRTACPAGGRWTLRRAPPDAARAPLGRCPGGDSAGRAPERPSGGWPEGVELRPTPGSRRGAKSGRLVTGVFGNFVAALELAMLDGGEFQNGRRAAVFRRRPGNSMLSVATWRGQAHWHLGSTHAPGTFKPNCASLGDRLYAECAHVAGRPTPQLGHKDRDELWTTASQAGRSPLLARIHMRTPREGRADDAALSGRHRQRRLEWHHVGEENIGVRAHGSSTPKAHASANMTKPGCRESSQSVTQAAHTWPRIRHNSGETGQSWLNFDRNLPGSHELERFLHLAPIRPNLAQSLTGSGPSLAKCPPPSLSWLPMSAEVDRQLDPDPTHFR